MRIWSNMDSFSGVSMRFWVSQDELDIDRAHFQCDDGWYLQDILDWLVVWNMDFIVPYIGNNGPKWLIFFRGVAQPPSSRSEIAEEQNMAWSLFPRAGCEFLTAGSRAWTRHADVGKGKLREHPDLRNLRHFMTNFMLNNPQKDRTY